MNADELIPLLKERIDYYERQIKKAIRDGLGFLVPDFEISLASYKSNLAVLEIHDEESIELYGSADDNGGGYSQCKECVEDFPCPTRQSIYQEFGVEG